MALKSKVATMTTTLAAVFTAVPTGKVWAIIGLRATNKTGAEVQIELKVVKQGGSTAYVVPPDTPIPAPDALNCFGDADKLVLEAGDELHGKCSSNSACDLVISFDEDAP